MFNEVVWLRHCLAFKGRPRQVVQAFEAATLQQLGKAALQRHLKAGVRTERGENTASTWVHQGHAHDREFTTQRGILYQHRKALLFQPLNTGQDTGELS